MEETVKELVKKYEALVIISCKNVIPYFCLTASLSMFFPPQTDSLPLCPQTLSACETKHINYIINPPEKTLPPHHFFHSQSQYRMIQLQRVFFKNLMEGDSVVWKNTILLSLVPATAE